MLLLLLVIIQNKMSYESPYRKIAIQKNDEDIDRLKHLVSKLLDSSGSEQNFLQKEEHYKLKISQLQKKIIHMSRRITELEKQHIQTVNQVQGQRERWRKQKVELQGEHRFTNNRRQVSIEHHETVGSHKHDRHNQKVDILIPEAQKYGRMSTPKNYNQYRRLQTPIDQLEEFNINKYATKDQVHRLNSYLIENTTTLKLLLEKHNYLLKLRGMTTPSHAQEEELLIKTKKAIANRGSVQQARSLLHKSRKIYFQSDNSSSEIENETNDLYQKTT